MKLTTIFVWKSHDKTSLERHVPKILLKKLHNIFGEDIKLMSDKVMKIGVVILICFFKL